MPLHVKLGVNPISWTNDDLPWLGADTPLEVALEEGSRIGYRGFELGNKFPREAAALRAVLGAHRLECVSGWYSGRLAARSVEEEIRAVEPHLRLLTDAGSAVMVYGEVQDSIHGDPSVPLHKRPHLRGADAWKAYGERMTAFGRYLLRQGLPLACHHHMGTYVQSPEDVDALMAASGEEVGLLFDSGHAAFGGADPVELLRKHASRVSHVHCKDVRPHVVRLAANRGWSFVEAVLGGVFAVPGDGAIDFRAILAVLHRQGYSGWLVVEADQDPAVAPSFASAQRGFRYLDGLLRELQPGKREAA